MTKPRVCIFSTCLVDLLFPNVGRAMVEVLERLGCETFLPTKQVCCGQPTYNSGYAAGSMKTFKNEIDALTSVDADYIVGPSGSCVFMIKEYEAILKDDPVYGPKAKQVADKIYEFSQFIYRVLGIVDCGAQLDAKATVHRSCHMTRLIGERTAPFVLLDHVKGLNRIPLKNVQLCCGFGGTFSAKHPELSDSMVDEKVQNIIDTEAEVLIGTEQSCLMNIAGRMNRLGHPIRVMHIAEVLNHQVDVNRIKYLADVDEAVVPANGEGVF